MSEETDNAFEELGRAIASQLTQPMEEHVESAESKLNDNDLVAFGLVAIRNGDDGVQSVSQRAIDPEILRESDRPPKDVIEVLHRQLGKVWESEIKEVSDQ